LRWFYGCYFFYLFLEQKIVSYFRVLTFLNTKNFKEIKLKGAIIGIGINFAIFGSIPAVIRVLSSNVLRLQKVIRLTRYFKPAFV
jgi:hypothetical protein